MTPNFHAEVETFFSNYMTVNHVGVPFYFDNSKVPKNQEIYVVFHALPSEDVLPITVGINAKSRNVGLIQVDVFGPKDVGAGSANKLAYDIGRAFKRRQITIVSDNGNLVFKDPAVVPRGPVQGKHKEQMRVPYRYDFQDYT